MKRFMFIFVTLLLVLSAKSSYAFWGLQTNVQGDSWEYWDEKDERGWTGSGTSVFIVLMENSVDGGDEQGQGHGINEGDADGTFTQVNNVSGVTDDYRILTSGLGQKFTFPVNLENKLFGSTEWLIIIKYEDYTSDSNACLINLDNDATLNPGYGLRRAGGVLEGMWPGFGAAASTANDPGGYGNTYWAFAYRKAGQNSRFGFSSKRPTRWSSIPAGNKQDAGAGSIFDLEAADVGNIGARAAAAYVDVKIKYIVISTDPGQFFDD